MPNKRSVNVTYVDTEINMREIKWSNNAYVHVARHYIYLHFRYPDNQTHSQQRAQNQNCLLYPCTSAKYQFIVLQVFVL
jgi:hypothetical protein